MGYNWCGRGLVSARSGRHCTTVLVCPSHYTLHTAPAQLPRVLGAAAAILSMIAVGALVDGLQFKLGYAALAILTLAYIFSRQLLEAGELRRLIAHFRHHQRGLQ